MPGAAPSPFNRSMDWRERLARIVDLMREMSSETDPQVMVRNYGRKVVELEAFDRYVSISRRDLEHPWYRITRDSTWREAIDPWKERHRLPLLQGGRITDIIYSNEPAYIEDLQLDPADPAAPFLDGYRTLIAVPHYDRGESLNMVLHLRRDTGFDPRDIPELVWLSCLFGRATYSLRLAAQLRDAYAELDRELAMVGEMQRSLLPETLPRIPGLDLAASYQTSRRAGGDYYDVFPLPDGRWGILIADVSGHGTPAAVLMAIVHALAHACDGSPASPSEFLGYLNDRLAHRYSRSGAAFVTALYVVYDPRERTLTSASAGHNPARLRGPDGRGGPLPCGSGLPLGIREGERYDQRTHSLRPGEALVMYTDGITEARREGEGGAGEMFGVDRLDDALGHGSSPSGGGRSPTENASAIVHRILASVDKFTAGRPAEDDRTILVAVADQ